MRFTSFTSPWVRLKIAARTGIEFSPVMRTKARGTAALKPSPVRSAESHGHGPVCLSPVSSLRLALCLRSLLVMSYFYFCSDFHLIIASHCLFFFAHRLSVILFFFAISLFLTPLRPPRRAASSLCLPLAERLLVSHVSLPLPRILTASLSVFLSCVMCLFRAHYCQASPVYSVNWYNPNINSAHLPRYKKIVWSGRMNYI